MTKFKVGDIVAVCCHRAVTGYEHTSGKIGHIVNIKSYTKCDKTYDRIYVDLSPLHNPAQEQGLFIFKKEELMLLKEEEPPTHAEHDFGVWTCKFSTDCVPNIKIKEEKKEMELLEIYNENQERKLRLQFNKKVENVKKQDETYKELFKIANKFSNVKGIDICIDGYVFDKEIETKLEKLHKQYNEDRRRLMVLHDEINAQIQICETYEQKQAILKAYGVIDEQGKLNK